MAAPALAAAARILIKALGKQGAKTARGVENTVSTGIGNASLAGLAGSQIHNRKKKPGKGVDLAKSINRSGQ